MLNLPLVLNSSALETKAPLLLRVSHLLRRALRYGILLTALYLSGCAQLPFQSHLLQTSAVNHQQDRTNTHSVQMADGGEFHGQGLMLHTCGYYEGEFQQGQYHGQGQLSCNDYFYEGEFKAGQPEGQGALTRYGVGTFTGQFHQGLPHGQLKAVFFKQSAYGGGYYVGNFTQGVIQGQGERLYPNGTVYRGHFKEGLPDGRGQIQWPNNDWFKGDFALGIPEGRGNCLLKGQQGLCVFKQGVLINFERQGDHPQQRSPTSHPNNGQSRIIAF